MTRRRARSAHCHGRAARSPAAAAPRPPYSASPTASPEICIRHKGYTTMWQSFVFNMTMWHSRIRIRSLSITQLEIETK
jgi:hypothetical protein